MVANKFRPPNYEILFSRRTAEWSTYGKYVTVIYWVNHVLYGTIREPKRTLYKLVAKETFK